MFSRSTIVQKSSLSIFFGFIAVTGGIYASSHSEMDAACTTAVAVDLIGSHRGYGSDPVQLLSLEAPAPGILALDVAVPGPARKPPRLGLLPGRCRQDGVHQDDVATIEQSATHLVLAVRNPGDYFFRLGAQDPRDSLGEYKLTTRFVPAAVATDELDWEAGRVRVTRTHYYAPEFAEKDGENEEEDLPNPDPGAKVASTFDPSPDRLLVSLADLRAGVVEKDGENEEEDLPNPDPGAKTAPGERSQDNSVGLVLFYDDPNETAGEEFAALSGADALKRLAWPEIVAKGSSVRSTGASALRFQLAGLCRVGERDDHGDTFTCATAIAAGRHLTGELGNGWGDDDDFFAITLSELRTVTIEATGAAGIFAELYDPFGQRLAISDEVGSIVKTLGPGRYFIRVGAAAPAAGAYQLNLEIQDW